MPLAEFVSESESKKRLNICVGDSEFLPCEQYFKLTGQCKKCGCFVKAKTQNRWDPGTD